MTTEAPLQAARRNWRERSTLTVEEAAVVLGLGRSSAYYAARAGEIPTVRIGRRVLVPTHALRRLLGEIPNESSPAGEPGSTKTADASSQHERYGT